MRIRVPFLCGLAAVICVLLGLLQIYSGQRLLPAPFSFRSATFLKGAMVVLLFGINWSCCEILSKKKG